MPIFEYQCDKCDEKQDKLVSRSDVDNAKTFPCDCEKGGTLSLSGALGAAALRFKGRWYSTTRGY